MKSRSIDSMLRKWSVVKFWRGNGTSPLPSEALCFGEVLASACYSFALQYAKRDKWYGGMTACFPCFVERIFSFALRLLAVVEQRLIFFFFFPPHMDSGFYNLIINKQKLYGKMRNSAAWSYWKSFLQAHKIFMINSTAH